mmetsp:Transcript_52380/g.159181  ORF Transcript_52380/g.159181 Transcript_52380/m.159181 type:complete len:266 (-) Transcript_52380:254-1051(-)
MDHKSVLVVVARGQGAAGRLPAETPTMADAHAESRELPPVHTALAAATTTASLLVLHGVANKIASADAGSRHAGATASGAVARRPRQRGARSGRKDALDLLRELIRLRLRVAEEHLRALLEEHRVLDVRVAARHGPLHEDGLLGLPHLQDGHARDRAILVLLGGAVGDVVGADDHADVGLLEIRVDLIHLQHPFVRHAGLGQQHIHLAGHAARHWVDAEAALDVVRAERGREVGDGALRARNSHAVAGDDDHGLGGGENRRGRVG